MPAKYNIGGYATLYPPYGLHNGKLTYLLKNGQIKYDLSDLSAIHKVSDNNSITNSETNLNPSVTNHEEENGQTLLQTDGGVLYQSENEENEPTSQDDITTESDNGECVVCSVGKMKCAHKI